MLWFVCDSSHTCQGLAFVRYIVLNIYTTGNNNYFLSHRYHNTSVCFDEDGDLYVPRVVRICRRHVFLYGTFVSNTSPKSRTTRLKTTQVPSNVIMMGVISDNRVFYPRHVHMCILTYYALHVVPKQENFCDFFKDVCIQIMHTCVYTRHLRKDRGTEWLG